MYFIDVQGTLIDDIHRRPIEGACKFIDHLNDKGIPYMIVTNNTKHSSSDFMKQLQNLGFHFSKENYLDPLMVLEENVKVHRIAAYGNSEFIRVVEQMGYSLDYTNPEAVLIGIKKGFTNEEYADMIGFILKGAQLVGMHETTVYAKDGKRYPGVGSILKMLSFAAGCSYRVVGKPSDAFYTKAKDLLSNQTDKEVSFKEITMISDDMRGDLVGIQNLGAKGVFVLSGKFKNVDEVLPNLPIEQHPSLICRDVSQYDNNYIGVGA